MSIEFAERRKDLKEKPLKKSDRGDDRIDSIS